MYKQSRWKRKPAGECLLRARQLAFTNTSVPPPPTAPGGIAAILEETVKQALPGSDRRQTGRNPSPYTSLSCKGLVKPLFVAMTSHDMMRAPFAYIFTFNPFPARNLVQDESTPKGTQ